MNFLMKTMLLCAIIAVHVMMVSAKTTTKPIEKSSERQLIPAPPFLPPTVNGGVNGLANIIPLILPIVLVLGLGAFILPAIGLFLFGGSGGFGGLFEGFGKKRSSGIVDHPLFSTEKLVELIQTVTKALEEASKEG